MAVPFENTKGFQDMPPPGGFKPLECVFPSPTPTKGDDDD